MTVAAALLATIFAIAFALAITLLLPPGIALAVVFTLVAGASLGGGPGLAWAVGVCIAAGLASAWLRRRLQQPGKNQGEIP
jgi:hypothetical protein